MTPDPKTIEVRLNELNSKICVLKARVQLIETFLDNYQTDLPPFCEIKPRIGVIKGIESNYEKIWNDFSELGVNIDDYADFKNVIFLFEEYFRKIQGDLIYLHDRYDFDLKKESEKPIPNHNVPSIPPLKIIPFDGTPTKWQSFKESCEIVFHNNQHIEDIHKFSYLRSYLRGDALEKIEGIHLTSSGYQKAWEELCAFYDGNRTVIDNHLDSLLNIRPITRDSYDEVNAMFNICSTNVSSLEAHGYTVDGLAEAMIVRCISRKFSVPMNKEWERSLEDKEMPTFRSLKDFLIKYCRVLKSGEMSKPQSKPEAAKGNSAPKTNRPPSRFGNAENRAAYMVSNPSKGESKPCVFCNAPFHPFVYCPVFQKMSVTDRRTKIRALNLCFNCFSSGHMNRDCQKIGCKKCKGKHHSMLHQDQPFNDTSASNNNSSVNTETPPQTNAISDSTANHSTFCAQAESRKAVMLSTALVYIRDKFDIYHECRALIDQGSQPNFLSRDFCNRVQFNTFRIKKMQISSIDQNKTDIVEGLCANIKSSTSDYHQTLQFLIVPSVTEPLPQRNINVTRWDIPKNIVLADPYFNMSRPIDMILGAEIFYDILTERKLQLNLNQPIFQETRLGWIVGGKYNANDMEVTHSFCINSVDNIDDLNLNVQKLWELDHIPNKKHLSKEESEVESHFDETHSRDQTGRYVVNLPLKDSVSQLGESYEQALSRFRKLEYRLDKNDKLKSDYVSFMDDYLQKGHMKPVNLSDQPVPKVTYYLPHHPVLKPTSSTTKLRVVFDASAKTTSDLSLNDVMKTGPTVQSSLFSIVLRFRKNIVALTSDISQMYRQVNVNPTDTPLQRILWRSEKDQPIQTYELTTVTYGTAAAPYMATRALTQLAEDEKEKFPNASTVVKTDFYVDDILTGTETIEEATKLQSDLIEMLALGGFKLHKWSSNSDTVLNKIPIQDREVLRSDKTSNREYIGTLGLFWKPKDDVFIFNINVPELKDKVTKRSALSDAAKLFDPLGLVSPSTIIAKLFIQQLWKIKSDWDDLLPTDMTNTWNHFLSELPMLNNVSLPRCVVLPKSVRFELHGFADASQQAYGCCVYLKSVSENSQTEVNLLCSKSRVAPLKTVSIPRLELCAALLLSELIAAVLESMHIRFDEVVLWSDSLITLQWIKIEPNRLKTFVANRVSKITELTSEFHWRHISTELNPADLVSRGIMPSQLIDCDIWWHGPGILRGDIELTEHVNTKPFNEVELELKKETVSLTTVNSEPVIDFERFSSFNRLLRTVAYLFRWKNIALNKNRTVEVRGSTLSVEELEYAHTMLFVYIQKQEFKPEYNKLSQGKAIENKSKLKSLNPFVDTSTGLLRVGGRLQNTNLDYDVKHQIILPNRHRVTDLLFRQFHLRNMHAGTQLLISIIRQKYWPIAARGIAKRIIRACIVCFRHKPILGSQLMGSLPADRVEIEKPFTKTGVDLCGPFYIKNKIPRNSPTMKVYVACFVCFLTKALHLEIVSDLSSECFIACLKRFLFRRANCKILWSDNATNFVGANRILQKEFEKFRSKTENERIAAFCASESITWKFIPPRSPNFGGLWESAVKSFKFHLKRVTNGATLSYEELNTLIIQVEGIVNSRPLTVISNDPNDPLPLTPSHFLTGGPISAPSEPSYSEIPTNRLPSWKRISQMVQGFWNRFSTEYIHSLQERKKWRSSTPNLKLEDVVLIVEDNLPPTKWLLGLVVKLMPGNDGNVRVVEIKTKCGVFKRAISKVAKLPLYTDE